MVVSEIKSNSGLRTTNSDYKMTNEESEHINDLWEDMDRLNALYEELMWDNDDVLEFMN